MCVDVGKGHGSGVDDQRQSVLVCHLCEFFDVHHLELWISDVFGEDEAGVVGNDLVELLGVGQVGHLCLDAQSCQCFGDQRKGVAEEVIGCHDGFSCLCEDEQGVEYGSHACTHGKDVLSSRERLHSVFKVSYGRVHHARVVWLRHSARESLRHVLGCVELVGSCVVNRKRERPVGIAFLKGGVNSFCLFSHKN